MVDLPYGKGPCIAQDGGPGAQRSMSVHNFLTCFVACRFVVVDSCLPGIVSGDRRREGKERKLFPCFVCFRVSLITHSGL